MRVVKESGAGFTLGLGLSLVMIGGYQHYQPLTSIGAICWLIGMIWLVYRARQVYRDLNHWQRLKACPIDDNTRILGFFRRRQVQACVHNLDRYREDSWVFVNEPRECWGYSSKGHKDRVTVNCVYAICKECGHYELYEVV